MESCMNLLKQINKITIYSSLLKSNTVKYFIKYLKEVANGSDETRINKEYYNFKRILINKAEKFGLSGAIFQQYIYKMMLKDENIFSHSLENKNNIAESLKNIVLNDISIIKQMVEFDSLDIAVKNYMPVIRKSDENIENLCDFTDIHEIYNYLSEYYKLYGCGDIAVYPMLRLNEKGKLKGIANYDKITFDSIFKYDYQKEVLRQNTIKFLMGHSANNCLLTGASGTGKSSCVKALANEYYEEGLRLVEISKDQVRLIPELLKKLSLRGKYFIVYIDDLSFEDFEVQYKYLKSALEGGASQKPKNVLFYATSNRRNIILEKWSDRTSDIEDGDVHISDTMNEKKSLSDRFGITISFPKPTPSEYVDIADSIARNEGIVLPYERIKELALKWELSQRGMSGRTARQFVNSLPWNFS